MWELWLQRLIKYDTLNYPEGDFAFQAGNFLFFLIPFMLALIVLLAVIYFISKIYLTKGSKAISWSIRLIVLLLLLIPLFEPVLMMPDIIPEENFLVILLDKSMSMGIADGIDGETRLENVRRILEDEETGVLSGLEENFKIRYYEFGESASRADSIDYTESNETGTNISSALKRIMSDYKGLPLAGVVMLSDGGDNSKDDPLTAAEELRGLEIPVHIIGMGSERFDNERELIEVNAGKGLSEGTGAEIDVKIRSWIN
ncbi:MAG: VWA domain-containing protein, partial [bacterium]|nr:VWA domain-containing protein [bacterium]